MHAIRCVMLISVAGRVEKAELTEATRAGIFVVDVF
jgi:hypothetical protein